MADIAPKGWSYEPADPSVGIFGEAFYHEDCPTPSDRYADESWPSSDVVRFTCRDCGASIEFEQPEPEPYDGEY